MIVKKNIRGLINDSFLVYLIPVKLPIVALFLLINMKYVVIGKITLSIYFSYPIFSTRKKTGFSLLTSITIYVLLFVCSVLEKVFFILCLLPIKNRISLRAIGDVRRSFIIIDLLFPDLIENQYGSSQSIFIILFLQY